MNYVGIDHHRQYSHVTVKNQRGQVLRSGRVPNLQSEMGRFLAGLAVFFIAAAVISLQTYRAATANPVESIRYE